MLASVVTYAPAIVAGSALSGFGLSFGRDVYRKAKQYWPIMVILVCLAGTYFSGVWLLRNYRTLTGTVLKKFGALIVLSASCVGVAVCAVIMSVAFPPIWAVMHNLPEFPFLSDFQLSGELVPSQLLWISVMQGALFMVGAVVGICHRKRRSQAWEAEDHNERFLAEHDLEVIDADEEGNIRIRDHSQEIGYRMSEDLAFSSELEFVALGRRNKRGYMQYDDTGKYLNWSGLVNVR